MTVKVMGLARRQTCWPCLASGMEARQGGDASCLCGSVHDSRPEGDVQNYFSFSETKIPPSRLTAGMNPARAETASAPFNRAR
jgi:hypothetical protein